MTTTDGCIPKAVLDAAMPNLLPCRCDDPRGSGVGALESVCSECHFIIPKGGQVWAQEGFPCFRVYLSLAGPVGVAWATHLMMLSEPESRGSMAHVDEHRNWLWPSQKLAVHMYKHRFLFKGDLYDIIAETGRRHAGE